MDTETINLLSWIGLRLTLQEGDVTADNVEGHAILDILEILVLL